MTYKDLVNLMGAPEDITENETQTIYTYRYIGMYTYRLRVYYNNEEPTPVTIDYYIVF